MPTLMLLPGDGIGPEVIAEVSRVIDWLNDNRTLGIQTRTGLFGGCSIDAHGTPLTQEVHTQAMAADSVLIGAVGGPKWDALSHGQRAESGLLRLRKDMDVYANLRPAICFPALADASSLRPEIVEGLDILFVRELTGGVYFGEPRGITTLPDGQRRGVNTQVYTTHEIQRVARVAFELARKRSNKICSAEKSNVMETGKLWREDVQALHDQEFADVDLTHMLADNCAMQLVKNPKQFDVIVTDNLFGDLLSDEAGMLTGSLGMLRPDGRQVGLYEPIHGSAPDIAGQGIANPSATLMSLAMCLRFSFDAPREADLIEKSIEAVLSDGIRTPDIWRNGCTRVGTKQMGDAILAKMAQLA
jgi:3-isopropylmalate dehydrogenase